MPPLREGDRYILGYACERSKTTFLPFFLFLNPLLLNLVRSNWLG